MKTVLKHGNRLYVVTCPVCGCQFLYEAEDISLNQVPPDWNWKKQVKCPECNTYIEATKVVYNEPKKEMLI